MTATQTLGERTSMEAFSEWFDRPFPGTRSRVPGARQWVRGLLHDHPCRDDAELVVSELAANAIAHTRSGASDLGMYRVVVYVGDKVVRVEVHDDGDTDTEPDVIPPDDECGHGRGLHVVEALADRWEFEGGADDGRCVWAELITDDSLPGLSAARPDPAG